MFIRKKLIKNKKTGQSYEYAYVVQNTWRKKGTRQKVKHYLGKVHKPELVDELDFDVHFSITDVDKHISDHRKNSIIKQLVLWELFQHQCEADFDIDFTAGTVMKGKKPAAIEMHEGMLSSYTLKKLLRFKRGVDERQTGYEFAKAFVEAGIEVPHEVFVGLFEKL